MCSPCLDRFGAHARSSPGDVSRFLGGDYCVKAAYETDPQSWAARETLNAKRTVWFLISEDMSAMNLKLIIMEAEEWCDRLTEKVEISVPMYTAEFGLHSLIYFNFYFSRGGHIWKQAIPLSAHADWYAQTYYAIYDSVWFCCVLLIFRSELREVRTKVRNKGWESLYNEYLGVWNIVDWGAILGGVAVAALSLASYNGTTKVNNEASLLPRGNPHVRWPSFSSSFRPPLVYAAPRTPPLRSTTATAAGGGLVEAPVLPHTAATRPNSSSNSDRKVSCRAKRRCCVISSHVDCRMAPYALLSPELLCPPTYASGPLDNSRREM